MAVGGRRLDQRADLGQGLAQPPGTEQLDGAAGGQHQPEQHPHRGGLARAVGAQEAVAVALAHVEVDVVDGDHPAIALDQTFGADHPACSRSGRSGGGSAASWARPDRSKRWGTVPTSR